MLQGSVHYETLSNKTDLFGVINLVRICCAAGSQCCLQYECTAQSNHNAVSSMYNAVCTLHCAQTRERTIVGN